MQHKLALIQEKIKILITTYPMVLLMSLALAASFIYTIEFKPTKDVGFTFVKLKIIFSIGISLMFAIKMLSQRIGKTVLWHILGVFFLIGFYFTLPLKEKDFTEVYAFLLVPTYLLSHLLVAFIAYLNKKNTEHSFWQFNKNLFINLFLTVVFIGVLTAGIEIAVLAIENLFNFEFEKIYLDIFVFFSISGSTFIFLLFNENGLLYLEREENYPVVLKFFTQFILIPLLFIYVVILYFYSAKIIINWELPRGWVSYLILAYSIIGILALLLVHPLKFETSKSWVKIFSKIFYYTLIPLIILLFTAIFTRVLQYGYTEARYFVLLIALWLTTVVLYFVFNKNATIKFIPVSLFLFGLFALIFPYFNTFSVSKRSQKKELETFLQANQLLVNGKINFNKPIADSIAIEVSDKLAYLEHRVEENYIENFLDKEMLEEYSKDEFWYWNRNKFKNIIASNNSDNQYISLRAKNNLYDVKGCDYVSVFGDFYAEKEIQLGDDKIVFYNTEGSLFVQFNDEEQINLDQNLELLFKDHSDINEDQSVDNLYIETKLDNYQIKMVFSNINRSKYKNSKIQYNFNSLIVLINKLSEH